MRAGPLLKQPYFARKLQDAAEAERDLSRTLQDDKEKAV